MTKEINQEKIFKFLCPDKCWHEWAVNKQIYWCKPCQHNGGQLEYDGAFILAKLCPCGCKYGLGGTGNNCLHCGALYLKRAFNPDLSTPDGMVMILDRLVEMGYSYQIEGHTGKILNGSVIVELHDKEDKYPFGIGGQADTAPLAVLNAVQALMEKEEKE